MAGGRNHSRKKPGTKSSAFFRAHLQYVSRFLPPAACHLPPAFYIGALNDPTSKETVAAQHHDRPLYILGNEPKGKNIRNAPFVNHTDQELMLIETLVGRTPPFVFPKADYSGPRRNY